MKEFVIQKNEAGQRLDKYLKKLLPQASSGFLYKMLRKKNITLNGKKAEGTELLKQEDRVRLFFSDETYLKFAVDCDALRKEFNELKTLDMKGLTVVYEDDGMLVAGKPFNMLSQKSLPSDISANERLLGYLIRNGKLTMEEYQTFHPSVCNRLDRNTTGLIIMGKTLPASQKISDGLKNRTIGKYYRAVVLGTLEKPQHLKGWLTKDEKTNQVTITAGPREGADRVDTSFVPLERKNGLTLIEIHLITGKTHQIRAHLASIGHPVLGDPKYGNQKVNQEYRSLGVTHQLLHAYRLELEDGRKITAAPPAVFERVMEAAPSPRKERI